MAGDVGKLALLLSADASGFAAGLGQAQRAAGTFEKNAQMHFVAVGKAASAMSVAVAAAGIAATAGLVAFGVSAIKSASDVSESQNKVNVVFGEGAKAINEFASTSAQKLGISRAAALDAAGGFGNLFTQLGIATPVAATMSKQMLTLAADLGSFHNADITQVIEAQTAAFRGEFDSVQKFVPTINAATVATKALEMSGKANEKALTDQDKALAVHALLLGGAGKATGDFANTSTGMANSLKIIQASFSDISTVIGDALLPAIAPLVTQFAQALPGAIAITQKAVSVISDTIGALASGEGFDTLYDGLITTFGPDTAAMIAAVIDPLAKVRTAISALASGDVNKAWELLAQGAKQASNAIRTAIETAVEVVRTRVGDFVGSLATWGAALVDWIAPRIPGMLAQLQGLGMQALTWIAGQSGALIEQLAAWGAAFLDWIGPKIPPLLAELDKLRASAFDWVIAQVPGLIEKLGQWATALVAWVAPRIAPLLAELGNLASRMLDWVAEVGPPLAQKILSEWVPAMIGWVAGAALKLVPELPVILATIASWIAETAPKIVTLALDLGVALVRGIISGTFNLAVLLAQAILGEVNRALGSVRAALGLGGGSPAAAEPPSAGSGSPARPRIVTNPNGDDGGATEPAPPLAGRMAADLARAQAQIANRAKGVADTLAGGGVSFKAAMGTALHGEWLTSIREGIAGTIQWGITAGWAPEKIEAAIAPGLAAMQAETAKVTAAQAAKDAAERAKAAAKAHTESVASALESNPLATLESAEAQVAKAEWIASLRTGLRDALAAGLDPTAHLKALREATAKTLAELNASAVAGMARDAAARTAEIASGAVAQFAGGLNAGAQWDTARREAWERAMFGRSFSELEQDAARAGAMASAALVRAAEDQRKSDTAMLAQQDFVTARRRTSLASILAGLGSDIGGPNELEDREARIAGRMGQIQRGEATGVAGLTYDVLTQLLALLSGGLSVQMDGQRVGRVVGGAIHERGTLLGRMGGF